MTSLDERADRDRLMTLLAAVDFADRYYALCAAFPTHGPTLSLDEQKRIIERFELSFSYQQREKFFRHRDPTPPAGHTLGLHVNMRDGSVEFVLVFATPRGHVGEPFSGLALDSKRRVAPGYKHSPAYPCPGYADSDQARDILAEGFALYQAVRHAILAS